MPYDLRMARSKRPLWSPTTPASMVSSLPLPETLDFRLESSRQMVGGGGGKLKTNIETCVANIVSAAERCLVRGVVLGLL